MHSCGENSSAHQGIRCVTLCGMAENFVDPFDMDMTEIFDDLHEFGEFPLRADNNLGQYNREVPSKVRIKAEPIYPTPAQFHPNVEAIPRGNAESNAEIEHQKQLRRRAQIGK